MSHVHAAPGCAKRLRDSANELTAVIGPHATGAGFVVELESTRPSGFPKFVGYEILSELGRGGNGVVYKARQTSLNRIVALKMVLGGAFADEDRLNRFRREAEAVARLQHPTIVQIFEVGIRHGMTADGIACPYISLEFVEGGSLAQKLGRQPQPLRESARMVEGLARAVHYAHERGIIHRDLKPGNVLLGADGTPKLTDFGLAKDLDGGGPDAKTVTGIAMGTPEYMAPEQAAGRGDVGPAADIYALGVILYEMLTGRRPFEGDNALTVLDEVLRDPPRPPRRLRTDVPNDLEVICLKCLEKEPGRRYQSAAALADDLARFAADEPIHARPQGPTERLVRWCRRKPLLAGMTAALLTVFLLGFAGVTALWLLADARGRLAEKKSEEARQALDGEAQARTDGQLHIARLDGVTAGRLLDEGDSFAALPWLVEMMQLEEQALANRPDELAERREFHRARLAAVLRQCPRLLQIWTHEHALRIACFSPDGRQIYTAALKEKPRVWDTATGELKLELPGGPNDPSMFSMTSNGLIALGAFPDTKVSLVDANSGEAIGDPLPLPGRVFHTELSSDGRRLLVGFGDAARLYDVASLKMQWEARPARVEAAAIAVAAFTARGRRVVLVGAGGEPELWEAETPKIVSRLKGEKTIAVCTSADGRRLATCSADGARLWDSETGKEVRALAHGAGVRHAAFCPDGRYLATAGDDGSARVWDVEKGGTPVASFRHGGRVVRVSFSPDGRRLLTASHDGTARVWGALTGRALLPPLHHNRPLITASFHPEGDRVLTAADDGVVRLWDVTEASHPAQVLRHAGPVTSAAFDRAGSRVATAARDGTVRVWSSAGAPASPWMRQPENLLHVNFHPDGRSLVTSGHMPGPKRPPGIVQGWDLDRFAPTDLRLTIGAGRVAYSTFSPDGRRVLLAGFFAANVWDRAERRDVASINHGHRLHCAAYSPDGKRVAVGSQIGFGVWEEGRKKELYRNQITAVYDVAFSRDGTRIAAGGANHNAGVYDATTGKAMHATLSHDGPVRKVVFSPNGKVLASAGDDRTARLWDVQTGQALMLPLQHRGPVTAVAFSADGKRLLTVCNVATDVGIEGQARWWDVATGEPLTPPLVHPGELHGADCSKEGLVATACQNDAAWLWPMPQPETMPADDLKQLAELLSGQRLDPRRGPVPMSHAELERNWRHLRSNHAARFELAAERVTAWRRFEAEECESARHWSGAAWFLDRLRAELPNEWQFAARRAHVNFVAGSIERAEKEMTEAMTRTTPAEAESWLRERSTLALAGQQWTTAKWYLEKLIARRTDDAGLYAERATVRGQLGDVAGRTADLAKAVEVGADGRATNELADVKATQGDWREAARLFRLAAEQGVPKWIPFALASLKAGDKGGYRKACESYVQWAATRPPILGANDAAWLCALAPGATTDYTAVVKLAEAALNTTSREHRAGVLNTLGAVLHRAGRHREAIERLNEGIKWHGESTVEDWIFLALSHQALGETDQAKQYLDKVRAVSDLPEGSSLWSVIERRMLRDELEAALK